jgi:hypothetical protein
MHFHFDLGSMVSGAAVYSALAYAAQTIPTPSNPWARWIIGVIQFVLSNKEKGQAAIAGKGN